MYGSNFYESHVRYLRSAFFFYFVIFCFLSIYFSFDGKAHSKLFHCFLLGFCHIQNCKVDIMAVGKSENPGAAVLFGGHNLSPLVEIGLTDLPKSEGAMVPLSPHGLS